MSDDVIERPEWGVVQLDRDLRIVVVGLREIADALRAERQRSTRPGDRLTMEHNALGCEDFARDAETAAATADYWVMYAGLGVAIERHVEARDVLAQWRNLHDLLDTYRA